MEIVELADDGYSGKNMERPGMQELLKLIRDNKGGMYYCERYEPFFQGLSGNG